MNSPNPGTAVGHVGDGGETAIFLSNNGVRSSEGYDWSTNTSNGHSRGIFDLDQWRVENYTWYDSRGCPENYNKSATIVGTGKLRDVWGYAGDSKYTDSDNKKTITKTEPGTGHSYKSITFGSRYHKDDLTVGTYGGPETATVTGSKLYQIGASLSIGEFVSLNLDEYANSRSNWYYEYHFGANNNWYVTFLGDNDTSEMAFCNTVEYPFC